MKSRSKYRTIKELSVGIYKEKGSKFVALAHSCYTKAKADQLLVDWKKEHHQCHHLCYAYRIGGDVYRVNDDGEPNNSAGQAILGQIDSFELTNILIGVVRYFGGTKLGAGGLVTAYRTAAKEAILNGQIIEMEIYKWLKLSFQYKDMPHIMNFLKKNNIVLKNKKFDISCELTVHLSLNKAAAIIEEMEKFNTLQIEELGSY